MRFEFEIEFIATGKTMIVFGYDIADACRRYGFNEADFKILGCWKEEL